MSYTSHLITEAINTIATLPGIGKKTALRLALFLLKNNLEYTEKLVHVLHQLRSQIQYCKQCNNISDHEYCSICTNPHRDKEIICLVENIIKMIYGLLEKNNALSSNICIPLKRQITLLYFIKNKTSNKVGNIKFRLHLF